MLLLFTRSIYVNILTGEDFLLCKNTILYQNIFKSYGFWVLPCSALVKMGTGGAGLSSDICRLLSWPSWCPLMARWYAWWMRKRVGCNLPGLQLGLQYCHSLHSPGKAVNPQIEQVTPHWVRDRLDVQPQGGVMNGVTPSWWPVMRDALQGSVLGTALPLSTNWIRGSGASLVSSQMTLSWEEVLICWTAGKFCRGIREA